MGRQVDNHSELAKRLAGVPISELLASAHCAFDFCTIRGQVSRGVYIVDASGFFYLNKCGKWDFGIQSDLNWWDNKDHAENFLAGQQRRQHALASAHGSASIEVYLTACKTFMCVRVSGMNLPICMRFKDANQLAGAISARLPEMVQ